MKKILHYLLAVTALVGLANVAKAANTGTTPYVGSTHTYKVDPGSDVFSNITWSVEIPVGETATNCYQFGTESNDGTFSLLPITWKKAGTYVLKVTETENGCSTVVTHSITVSNSFDVSTTNLADACNNNEDNPNPADDATTNVSFTITMNTGVTNFNPEWNFKFTIDNDGATISNVKVNTTDLTDVSGTYTSPNLTSATGAGTATVSFDVTGSTYTQFSPSIAITSAQETTYNTQESENTNNSGAVVIKKLPQTSAISFN